VINITFPTTVRSYLTDDSRSNSLDTLRSPTFIYSLDNECQTDLNNPSSDERQKEFNKIFDTQRWGTFGSRSGEGSTIEGAFDWIRHLRSFFEHYSIRSVADIPCGDTYWQFSIRELNTIDGLYFGGDISTNIIQLNKKLYGSKHRNKLFQYWDLVRCPIPTYTYMNSTHKIQGNQFDLIIVRDAIQHMHIKNGLKAVQNVVRSGAKFFALTSFPPNGKSSASNTRSIEKNESLPLLPAECDQKNYCEMGNIKDGDYYTNNINCYPFNFPLNKAILLQPSHEKFHMESDEIHIYEINDELKQIVEQYDHACSEKY
jgi:ubiquinone/menaquinone biosynthesis C-methylase UbiE